MKSDTTTHPLAGIKVLDLTRLLPGPLCGQYFADLGAEVLKIEDTHLGDYARPAVRDLVNRGKKAMRLNLKTAEGKEIFLALADKADVVIESFRPGTMQRLGIGYEALRERNPRLVYCAISGYGQTGPRQADAGHDINFLALTGVLDQTGDQHGPVIPGFLIGDLAGGTLSATSGILVALLQAQRTGRGRLVDVSMADSLLSQAVLAVANLNDHTPEPPRGAGSHTGGNAHYNVYKTKDGRHLAIGAQEKKFWDNFCQAISRPDLKDMHSHSLQKDDTVKQQVAATLATRTLAEWNEVLGDCDGCVTPVLSVEEAVQDPHFRGREVVSSGDDGGLRLGLPFKLSEFELDAHRPSPEKGEHTTEVLESLGYGGEEIRRLGEEGVV